MLVALASWSESDVVVDLTVDLEALGLGADPRAYAPAVEGLQSGGEVDLAAVSVPARMGMFLVLDD